MKIGIMSRKHIRWKRLRLRGDHSCSIYYATADIGGVEKDPFCTNGGADVDGKLQ